MKDLKLILQAALSHAHTERGHGNEEAAKAVETAVARIKAVPKKKPKQKV